MKILVIDDKKLHRDAAVDQFQGHDLTVVETYDEGQKALGYDNEDRMTSKHDFDAVFVDLMLPASDQQQAGFDLAGTEMPVGIFLALLAAKNAAKPCQVGLLTDTNHHQHPASACIDAFGDKFNDPSVLDVGSSKLILANQHRFIGDRGEKKWKALLESFQSQEN